MTPEFLHSARMQFWQYARKRYQILLDRTAGKPAPWTDDPVLGAYRFCNIFREDDVVTKWIARNIREPMADAQGDLVFALIAGRLFNLPSTLERLLPVLQPGRWDAHRAKKAIEGLAPVVSGAYIVIGEHQCPTTGDRLPKGAGIVQTLDNIWPHRRHMFKLIRAEPTLQNATAVLATPPRMGNFLAYEVATDLRHTPVLNDATDIMTWANPGPGAARGLSRLIGEDKGYFNRGSKRDREIMFDLMRQLLEDSNHEVLWPAAWPRWEMRDVEHTLCEVDKYLRVVYGEGRPKQTYRT